MTQEEKELLLKDLCGRLPYGVKTSNGHGTLKLSPRTDVIYVVYNGHIPYLRPMTSMSEEEDKEFWKIVDNYGSDSNAFDGFELGDDIDWLNAHHFDYRGLIEIGLALVAPEGIYE